MTCSVANKERLTRHRVYEYMVDKDLQLCLPDQSEKQTLGDSYMPMARVGLLEVSLVLEELYRSRMVRRFTCIFINVCIVFHSRK